MTQSDAPTARSSAAWLFVIVRAIPALALGVVITFTAQHSSALGLVSLGIFGLSTGVILVVSIATAPHTNGTRSVVLAQGIVLLVVGAVALAAPSAGLEFLILLITGFAVVTGFLELYLGMRKGRATQERRDGIFLGGLTVLLALAVLVVPPGFSQSSAGPDGIVRELTASVIIVGLLGAYWIVIGIYLVIAGLSLKWSAEPAGRTATSPTKTGA
jgi:uncharacterized membrane protein HdeD (DUF308 family)